MTRKTITERMKRKAIQAHETNFTPDETGRIPIFMRCAVCKKHLSLENEEIEWDHHVPLALGGAHDYRNIRPLHKACHARKTFGTKSTTAGSDIHMIAKAKRIAKGKTPSKRPMPGSKGTPWKKTMAGKTVRRK